MSKVEQAVLHLSFYLGIIVIVVSIMLVASLFITHDIKTVKGTVNSIYAYNDYISITVNDITYNIDYPDTIVDIQKNDVITMKLENTNYFFYDDGKWNEVNIVKESIT